MIDVAASRATLAELRHARRHHHRDAAHWIDALYRSYLMGMVAFGFTIFASTLFPKEQLDAAGLDRFVAEGPAWLGIAVAFVIALGLRSGARGGPLTLEPAAVQHELLAPIDTASVLREPALKLLRFMAFSGLLAGGILGLLATRRVDLHPALVVAGGAAFGALTASAGVGAAMVVSGRHLSRLTANVIAAVLLAWAVGDVYFSLQTSPTTWIASVAFWGIRFVPVGVAGVAVVVPVVALGLASIGGTSIEAARHRAGLVSQLRFAATLQDIRTVVLLRRQLAQEKPRTQPWIRMRRNGRMPAPWRRDWQSIFRFPAARLARMVLLAAVAGLAMGATWRGITPAFVVAAIALYLAAYDATEPIAQEVDHPTRWDALSGDPGRLLLAHLPAALVVMVLVTALAAAFSLILVPASVVTTLAPSVLLAVAAAATLGAAVSTTLGAPDVSALLGLGSDMLGMVLLARLVLPPALTVAALAPLLAAGTDPNNLNTLRVSNAVGWSIIGVVAGVLWLRTRKPTTI
jgi:hypothetical protein